MIRSAAAGRRRCAVMSSMKIMNDDNNVHQYDNGEFLKKEIQSEKKERNKKHTNQFYTTISALPHKDRVSLSSSLQGAV